MGISGRYFEECNVGMIEGIMTGVQDGINYGVVLFYYRGLGTGFCGDVYLITLGIYQEIELDFSDNYYEGCNDTNIGGLVTVVLDVICVEVSWCVAVWLGTFFI